MVNIQCDVKKIMCYEFELFFNIYVFMSLYDPKNWTYLFHFVGKWRGKITLVT